MFVQEVNALLALRVRFHEQHTLALEREAAPWLVPIHDMVVMGGKRIRPWLCYLMLEAMERTTSISDAAFSEVVVALEMFQAHLLAHDDWMDQDEVRRGKPTMHKRYTGGNFTAHQGGSLAILGGDLHATWGWHAAVEAGKESADPGVAMLFAEMLQEVIMGQYQDIALQKDACDLKMLEHRYVCKTASYTTRTPMALAYRLCHQKDMPKALRDFADALGVGFQMRDDWNNAFNETEEKRGSDMAQGKKTVLYHALLEQIEHQKELQELKVLWDRASFGEGVPLQIAKQWMDRCRSFNLHHSVEVMIQKKKDACLKLLDAAIAEGMIKDALPLLRCTEQLLGL